MYANSAAKLPQATLKAGPNLKNNKTNGHNLGKNK